VRPSIHRKHTRFRAALSTRFRLVAIRVRSKITRTPDTGGSSVTQTQTLEIIQGLNSFPQQTSLLSLRKKADVVEYHLVSGHVGLLYNGFPGVPELPFIKSSDIHWMFCPRRPFGLRLTMVL
jgi:hypothetical protein